MINSSLKKGIWLIAILMSVGLAVFAKAPDPELKFRADGTFKIVQFTDIHWDNGSSNNERVLGMMADILAKEQPDLVVLTGDIVTTTPAARGWQAVVQPIIDRKIPWAVTLGNHDDEYDLKRTEIITLLEKLPYSCVEAGPTSLGADGNYILKIESSAARGTVALLYCLDSNAYSTLEGVDGYGWIAFEQVEWFRKQSAEFKKANGDKPVPALAFFHIPVPEYNEVWDSPDSTCIGVKNETVCAPAINTGLFAAMLESKSVLGVFVGHDHDNDFIGSLHGIALSYGRATGFDSYGDLTRGARVIELLEGKREFVSWIRTENGEVLNQISFPQSFEKPMEP